MDILYIDDDASNRAVMRGMLATSGVKMFEAADATSGLRMIAEQGFTVVLMDLRMPGVSGLTAIRQLRAAGSGHQHLPIVVVTADLTPGVQALCRGAGANDFIAKPVGMSDLFNVIGAALARSNGVQIN